MNLRMFAAAALAVPALCLAQQGKDERPAPARKPAPLATVNGVPVPQSRMNALMQQYAARGGQNDEATRARMREELLDREVLRQEAQRTGIAKRAEVQGQLELARQEVVVGAYVGDWMRKHPVSDAEVQREYDRARAQAGDKEYRARHILVETEDEAKGMIAELKKGGSFEELAGKRSRDGGTKERGGDLDWNVPAAFDPQFSAAMVKLEKGRYTETPVGTRFGFHVVRLDDVRPVQFPALPEVRARIEQQLAQARLRELIRGLRAKAKIE